MGLSCETDLLAYLVGLRQLGIPGEFFFVDVHYWTRKTLASKVVFFRHTKKNDTRYIVTIACVYMYIYIYDTLAGGWATPLKKVSWDCYSQNMENTKCFKPQTRLGLVQDGLTDVFTWLLTYSFGKPGWIYTWWLEWDIESQLFAPNII